MSNTNNVGIFSVSFIYLQYLHFNLIGKLNNNNKDASADARYIFYVMCLQVDPHN